MLIEPPPATLEVPGHTVSGHTNVQMAGMLSARFRAGMRPLAIGTALLVALAAPLADFLLERRDLAHRGHLHAAAVAARLFNLEAATRALSLRDTTAIQRLIDAGQQGRGSEDVAHVELWDENHLALADSTISRAKPSWPLVWAEEPVSREGKNLGTVRVAVGEPELLERDLLLLGVFGLLGLVLGFALYYFPLRLFREEDLVLLFARRSIRAAEEERLRLSRDLHDGLGQTLGTAAVALVRLAARAGPVPEATETARLIDRALDELRHVSLGLRPPSLDDLGLASAVGALAREAEGTGLAGTVEIEELPRMDPELELACFRLAQEGLSNLVRHASAKSFRLSLAKQGEQIVLEVQDDGSGFTPASQLGLGLVGARERAAGLAGTFTIESAPNRGTRFRAQLPFKPEGQS